MNELLSRLWVAPQQLKEQLPSPEQGGERLKEWWNANGQTWAKKLKFDTSLPQHRSSMAVQRSAEGSAEVLRFHTVASALSQRL